MTLRPFDKLRVAPSPVEGRPAQGHSEQRRGVRIFGIDPGSERTGYGCVETDGRAYHLVACGAITARAADGFPQRLERIHRELTHLLGSEHATAQPVFMPRDEPTPA